MGDTNGELGLFLGPQMCTSHARQFLGYWRNKSAETKIIKSPSGGIMAGPTSRMRNILCSFILSTNWALLHGIIF